MRGVCLVSECCQQTAKLANQTSVQTSKTKFYHLVFKDIHLKWSGGQGPDDLWIYF